MIEEHEPIEKTGSELRCSRRVSSFYSTRGNRHVTLVDNLIGIIKPVCPSEQQPPFSLINRYITHITFLASIDTNHVSITNIYVFNLLKCLVVITCNYWLHLITLTYISRQSLHIYILVRDVVLYMKCK
jgi:hypothetical protein